MDEETTFDEYEEVCAIQSNPALDHTCHIIYRSNPGLNLYTSYRNASFKPGSSVPCGGGNSGLNHMSCPGSTLPLTVNKIHIIANQFWFFASASAPHYCLRSWNLLPG